MNWISRIGATAVTLDDGTTIGTAGIYPSTS
jgi:hypothetical protein